ncbi:MAG: DUF4149 domain-containing protein [Hydrogenovibrio sp.]|nr:DUF4149 domain-containing protein [Hydrogenovibrio sp.]
MRWIPGFALVWLTVNVTIGYVVAPVLFDQLASKLAGQVMSVLLSGLYQFDLVAILLMLMVLFSNKRCQLKRETLLVFSALLVGLNAWVISPKMEWLKSQAESATLNGLGFGQWHGISQGVFLLGLVLFAIWCFQIARAER